MLARPARRRAAPAGPFRGNVEDIAIDDDEPSTGELRIRAAEREEAERRQAREAGPDGAAEQHERRADKSAYLRRKLEERERAERESEGEDRRP